jgi:TatA/E family protein of Tat protein translocase
MFMLFLPENPMIWILIVGVIFLLFGGSRLPQLARALGQSKRSFKEGLQQSEDIGEDQQRKQVEGRAKNQPSLESIDDEALFAEADRRARLRDLEKKH